MIGYFETCCKAIFERYKDKVKYWLTVNEINSGTMPRRIWEGISETPRAN